MAGVDNDHNPAGNEEDKDRAEHQSLHNPLSRLAGTHELNDEMTTEPQIELLDMIDSWGEANQIEAPRSEPPSAPSSVHIAAPSWTSEDIYNLSRDEYSVDLGGHEASPTRHNAFTLNIRQNANNVELARAESTSTLSSTSEDSFVASRRDSISAPQSPECRSTAWRDSSAETTVDHAFNREPIRPTSVPNLQSQSGTRKRKDGPEYPAYPNQSFATLHAQQYPSSYQPHPLRTRSSHPSQSSSYSSGASRSRDFPSIPSGAKTAGNTPAQSPGLFTPTMSRNRPSGNESEDSHYNTPLLHPSHLQAPKETRKLLKDFDPVSGRKLVNNYEFCEKLGSGTHGTVKLGRNLDTSELVAVKIVRRFSKKVRLGKSGDPNDMIKKEVAILKKARHPHVVSLFEVIDDDEFGKVYLILEYVELGEIVWRKQTDKDVAMFEMNRVKREKLGTSDDATEIVEIESFNATAMLRRAAKAQANEWRSKTQNRVKVSSSQERGHSTSTNPFWTLEDGHEPEEEGSSSKTGHRYSIRPPRAEHDSSQTITKFSPMSSTPAQSDTPRPKQPNYDNTDMLHMISDPKSTSHPESPVSMEGTMYEPYASERWSPDRAFQSKFDHAVTGQSGWTAEEEEFMHVPCLTTSQALDAFRDTVLGLGFLHYQGIIHRDIKPANLLWTRDRRVKISDFGVSYLGKPIREDEHHEEIPEADAANLDEALELAKTVGTPAFYAPELCDPELFDIAKHPERPQITGQIDVWALGVTLYGMIYGRLPFFDVNEFAMYEKIARQDVFIPRIRLRGVEEDEKTPTSSDKRLDDILKYEEVDEDLRDLIGKLLIKDPTKRITLKEVNHHPWVLRGIGDISAWLEQADPSLQSQGKKIEVSPDDVQEAVVGLTIADRIKSGIRRIGSVVRGRDHRKRGHSSAKTLDTQTSTSPSSPSMSISSQHERRSSLKSDEQLYSALRAYREGTEHPLSQSVAASPEMKTAESYFESGNTYASTRGRADEDNSFSRPILLERTLSNAESTKTIRPAVQVAIQEIASAPAEHFSPMTPVVDTSSSSGLGGIFGGAGRRFVNTMRSRERGRDRERHFQSSRSSSTESSTTGVDDPHGSPSIAFSSAIAAGHVDLPAVHRDISLGDATIEQTSTISHSRLTSNTAEIHHYAQEVDLRRRSLDHSHMASDRCRKEPSATEVVYPASPTDYPPYQLDHSQAGHTEEAPFGISSSSDQIASGMSETTSHPSIPSVISGASSLSAQADDYCYSDVNKEDGSETVIEDTRHRSMGHHSRRAEAKMNTDDDEAGYNGEGELDSDSDDDGIEMAGGMQK